MPITTDLEEPTGQVRLEIGDDTEGAGVRPKGVNFTDTHIAYFLEQEGDHVGRAAARACEALARDWAKVPNAFRIGPEEQEIKTAEFYRKEAQRLRRVHGFTQIPQSLKPSGVVGVVNFPPGTAPS